MKKILATILLSCMVLSLCACGSGKDNTEKNTQNTESQAKDSQTKEDTEDTAKFVYKIKVVDEAGTAVSGVMVQICNEDGCCPALTNAEGVAEITVKREDGNKASVSSAPEGYEYTDGDVYFEDGEKEMTLTLKAVK